MNVIHDHNFFSEIGYREQAEMVGLYGSERSASPDWILFRHLGFNWRAFRYPRHHIRQGDRKDLESEMASSNSIRAF